MDSVEFSRQSASIWNGILDYKERREFQVAAIYALENGGENPLKLMPTKFKSLFKKQG